MSEPSEKQIQLIASDELRTSGTAMIQSWTEDELKKRAVKAWVISWALAFTSLFLPVAHFFLVPMFLISGPLAFVYFKKMKSKIIRAGGPCPHCQATFEIHNQPDKWPVQACCDKCRKNFKVDLS